MSATDGVVIERQGATVVLTMSNPGRRNAFFPEMRRKLAETLYKLGMDPEVRAFVLTGEEGHFCAGADLSRSRPTERTALSVRENTKDTHHLMRAIVSGARPVIAAVEGDAFGAGMSITAACDKVFAARSARFGSAFAKIGILPDMGILYTLPQRVGLSKARELLMLAIPIGAEEAHRIGLVDELVEPGKSLEAALRYAALLAELPPLAITYTKAALATGVTSIEDAMRLELDLQPILALSEDSKEGVLAFKEKRKPKFSGK
jgi:2-(1,2-epoxy-1,2-dihydrophenyl)acetyl-CoA isomerase